MNISLMPQTPPYVQFEQRAVEDRNASIETGGLVMRDIDYVIVMQKGSRDTFEKEAADWLNDIERLAREGLYPAEWAQHFRNQYAAFKQGQALPELGTPIRHWPSLSKAQAENVIAAGCRSVEDLASANEQTLHRIGMGARELQTKARAYIASRDQNKAAEKITALEAQLADANARNQSLENRIAALETQGSKKRA